MAWSRSYEEWDDEVVPPQNSDNQNRLFWDEFYGDYFSVATGSSSAEDEDD